MRSLPAFFCGVVSLSGCVGAGAMRSLAPDRGIEVRYNVSVDTLLAALPGALAGRRLGLAVREPYDSVTVMFIALRRAGPFSHGELVRVLVRPETDGGQASARVVARSGFALDLSGRVDRVSPRFIQALDESLGPAAMGLFSGMLVRGRTEEGAGWLRGTLVARSNGALHLEPGYTSERSVPLEGLRDLAVFRGSYTHRYEGANLGGFAGLVAGAIIGATTSDRSSRLSGAASGIWIGGIVGTLVGTGMGAMVRTEVWSEAAGW